MPILLTIKSVASNISEVTNPPLQDGLYWTTTCSTKIRTQINSLWNPISGGLSLHSFRWSNSEMQFNSFFSNEDQDWELIYWKVYFFPFLFHIKNSCMPCSTVYSDSRTAAKNLVPEATFTSINYQRLHL